MPTIIDTVVAYLETHPKAKPSEIAEATGLPTSQVVNALRKIRKRRQRERDAEKIHAARKQHPDKSPEEIARLTGQPLEEVRRGGWNKSIVTRVWEYLQQHPDAQHADICQALGLTSSQVSNAKKNLRDRLPPRKPFQVAVRTVSAAVEPVTTVESSRQCVHVRAHQLRSDFFWVTPYVPAGWYSQWARSDALEMALNIGAIPECDARCK